MVATLSRAPVAKPGSLIDRLFYHAEANPGRDAVVSPDCKLTYAQLAALLPAQAQKFYDAGISSDSVIGIRCADDTQHLVLCLAATYVGATSITVSTHEADASQKAIMDRCGITHVVDENIAIDPTAPHLKGSDRGPGSTPLKAPAAHLLFSTSGTSGDPKLVLHHDSDLVAQAHRHIASGQERFACLASMEHNFAKRHRLYCVAEGATNVFPDADRDSLVAQCQSLGVNVMHVSAFQAQELLATPGIGALSNIRLKLGGSHVPVPLRQQLRDQITDNLQAGYGTTETGAIAFTDPDDSHAGESVGRPLPGIEIRVVGRDREMLELGEHGELAIRCDGMFRQYLGNPELTTARLEDGWFYTGDIGYLDDQQRIYLSGRSDDMFVFNSLNIYPQDIETRICQFPGIADAAVLPKESPVHGCIPVALVVFSKGAKPKLAELNKFVNEHAGIRSPRQYIVVNEIPRNASGKIARGAAMKLSESIDNHRQAIIQALDTRTKEKLKPSQITAFENGEADITLREIDMDSLARMELLIALEVEHGLIMTPQEFNERGSLGKIATRLLSTGMQAELAQDTGRQTSVPGSTAPVTAVAPDVVRFFQRVFSYCHTVVQFNRALMTLAHRLTPVEIEQLSERHGRGQLIPAGADAKFHTVFTLWMQKVLRQMRASGKTAPEPFARKRMAATATHFSGPGAAADKTLLICFSAVGTRSLLMPNAVLLQHTDSAAYDLLVIGEPLNQGYQRGVPGLGRNLTEIIEWLATLELIHNYRGIRTLGASAGAYAAVLAAHRLNAELAVSAGGRFHSWRTPGKIFERIITAGRTVRRQHRSPVLLCYDIDKTRDGNFARIMSWIGGGRLVALEFTDGSIGHLILERLIERGELASFLARTLFADTDDELIGKQWGNAVLSFPANEIRPLR